MGRLKKICFLRTQMTCSMCFQTASFESTICGECFLSLEALRVHNTFEYGLFKALGIYYYRDEIKELIRRAKITSDWRSLRLLTQLFINSESLKWGKWADWIVPSPSSGWGRLHGRFDLASYLSHNLAKSCGKNIRFLPLTFYGRFSKKSMTHRTDTAEFDAPKNHLEALWASLWQKAWKFSEKAWIQRMMPHSPEPLKILLIDDVVTTGQTLEQSSQHLLSMLSHHPNVYVCKLALSMSCDYVA